MYIRKKKFGPKKKIGRPFRKPIAGENLKKLNNLVYGDKYLFGRDKLFKLAEAKGLKVSRRQISDWLSKQEYSQLYAPEESEKLYLRS